MRRTRLFLTYTFLIIAVLWTIVTIYAELPGPDRLWELGNLQSEKKVLIVFDPDPFYNLDEQLSFAVGNELARRGMFVTVASVAATRKLALADFQLFVVCANTYNWGPDWAVGDFVNNTNLAGRNVVAITLGSGSTGRAQRRLEEKINKQKAVLLGSRSFWLLRLNDESRVKESNAKVAIAIATDWVTSLVK